METIPNLKTFMHPRKEKWFAVLKGRLMFFVIFRKRRQKKRPLRHSKSNNKK